MKTWGSPCLSQPPLILGPRTRGSFHQQHERVWLKLWLPWLKQSPLLWMPVTINQRRWHNWDAFKEIKGQGGGSSFRWWGRHRDHRIIQEDPTDVTKDEIRSYQESAKCRDPMMFWRINGYSFFHLERLARKYLCTQGTLVSPERVLSTSGDILSAECSCQDPDALDAMIFLKKSDSCDFLQEHIWL